MQEAQGWRRFLKAVQAIACPCNLPWGGRGEQGADREEALGVHKGEQLAGKGYPAFFQV